MHEVGVTTLSQGRANSSTSSLSHRHVASVPHAGVALERIRSWKFRRSIVRGVFRGYHSQNALHRTATPGHSVAGARGQQVARAGVFHRHRAEPRLSGNDALGIGNKSFDSFTRCNPRCKVQSVEVGRVGDKLR